MGQTEQSSLDTGLNVVAIGGGNGLSTLLYGLKRHVSPESGVPPVIAKLSAIVTVSDDGGSSGRLRDELQMLPPGDIRNCMVALSEDSRMLSKLFRHRFRGEGDLGGHSFGNIFLAALTEITGDFTEAVRLSSEILASKGHIFPATMADVRLAAELDDGTTIRGESRIGSIGKAIKRVYLEPESCKPMPDTLTAIANADIISIGPGSLFTSLLPPLLVDGVAEAIAASDAIKVFVCNLMTQPGETDGFTSRKHLEVIRDHVPAIRFNYIILNQRSISDRQQEVYLNEGAVQIGVHGSISESTIEGVIIIYGNLLEEGEKVRHDPAKLAKVVLACAINH